MCAQSIGSSRRLQIVREKAETHGKIEGRSRGHRRVVAEFWHGVFVKFVPKPQRIIECRIEISIRRFVQSGSYSFPRSMIDRLSLRKGKAETVERDMVAAYRDVQQFVVIIFVAALSDDSIDTKAEHFTIGRLYIWK